MEGEGNLEVIYVYGTYIQRKLMTMITCPAMNYTINIHAIVQFIQTYKNVFHKKNLQIMYVELIKMMINANTLSFEECR